MKGGETDRHNTQHTKQTETQEAYKHKANESWMIRSEMIDLGKKPPTI